MRPASFTLAFTLATLIAPHEAMAQLAPARRPFLFKDDRGDLAAAHARGEPEVTVLIAAMPGANPQLADLIGRMGGTIRFRDDTVDYLRARVPTDSVDRLSHDPLVHSLDLNVKGQGRTFSGPSDPVTPRDALPQGSPARGRPAPGAPETRKAVWPPVQSDYPLTHRYDPLGDMGAAALRQNHPTWDGRGVTLAMIDMNPDPFEPELQVARTLDGRPAKKIALYQAALDKAEEDDGRWLDMKAEVTATGGTFTYGGKAYQAPHDGTFRIAILDEAEFDSLSSSVLGGGLEKDLNRDGNPPGSSRLFAVLWDRTTNDVWVDTNQNLSFTDERALTDYRVRPEFGTFGKDDPKTPVRESVGFAVQTDAAKQMVAIDAGVPVHASLIVGAGLGSRGTRGRYNGVAPGARLASVAEGCQAYGQTEAVIIALENPQVDGAWLEHCSNITRPYLLRDGRLVPTVIYSRLLEKYHKPLMIPTHNYPVLGASDDFVLADCGIGVGGQEGKQNFFTNYGFRTKYDDNLLVTGGYGPMGNGAFGPTIISPSNIMSGYRGWEHPRSAYLASVYLTPPGYLIAGGTSTATPTASGAVAMLISAARQTGVKHDACRLKEAIASSARWIPNLPAYKQGNGMINVAGAWELLKALDTAKTHVTITSRAPVKHAYGALLPTPDEGVSLFEREGWSPGDRGQRTITFTRTSGPGEPMTFTLSFTGDSGTYAAPTSVTLPLNEPVAVTLDITPKTPGVHSALLTLDHPRVPGHAYRLLTTIVAAEALDAGNHFAITTKTEVPRPEMRSFFYRVPEGVSALEVMLDAPKRAVEVAMIAPDTRTAPMQQIVAERQRGEGAGGGGPEPPRPKETLVSRNPMPGVWEIRLADLADVREFDWRASMKGGPVPPTEVTITVSALAVGTSPPIAVGGSGSQEGSGGAAPAPTAGASPPVGDFSLASRMAGFTGRASSYPLASARRERPTIADREQQVYQVDVPAGSRALLARASRPSDPKADLDVYVYDCSGKECRIAESSADPVGDATVLVQNPSPGKWKIVVDGASVPSGRTSYDYVDAVFNQTYGMVSVTDTTAKHEDAAPWSARANVWVASLPAGREPYAAILVEGEVTRTQPFTIGMLEVPGAPASSGTPAR
jgi:hypothetical protein